MGKNSLETILTRMLSDLHSGVPLALTLNNLYEAVRFEFTDDLHGIRCNDVPVVPKSGADLK